MPRIPAGTIVYSNGLQFDGSTQYASRATVLGAITDNFTLAMWVKVVAWGGGTTYWINTGSSEANGTRMGITSAGLFKMEHNFVVALNSAATLTAGVWYHVATIRNGGTTQNYVNAVASGGTTASAPNSPGSNITLGASQNTALTASLFCSCVLDDVRPYSRAISTTELTNLYNHGLDVNNLDIDSANLLAWWKLNETSGTSAADSSGNAKTLTLTATPSWVTGKVQTSNTPARTAVTSPARSVAGTRTLATI